MGLHITSPYFLYNKVALRVKGNFMWNEHLDSDNSFTWSSYSNVSFGIIGVSGKIQNFMRLYGEGGFLLLFPSVLFSSSTSETGGYGLLGFEFFSDMHSNYYIEIGAAGTGATADKVAGNPIYSNGLLINVGYRFQF